MHKNDYKDSHARVCLSRLTRLLDMDILEDLQQLEYTDNVTRNLEIERTVKPHRSFFSKSTEKLNKIISRKGSHKIFGHSLTEDAVHRISTLIDFLKSHVSKEGLFRVSGSKKRQEELKALLDKEEHVDFDSGGFTPHDVACVLKIFLGELPEPLLTHAPQGAYREITEIRNDESEAKLIEALQLLFLLVPPQNRMLLEQLLELLNLVTNSADSKMTAHNLALVFSPNIMDFKKKIICQSQVPKDISFMQKLVASMICHAKELFKIPNGLIEDIDAAEAIVQKGSEELPVTRTFCQQMDQNVHKQTVQQTTTESLIQLYNHVVDLPDGPVKQKFMQRFQKVHPGTPPFVPRSKNQHVNQMDVSTPVKSAGNPGAFINASLSPITERFTAPSTPTMIKRVTFDVVDTPDSYSGRTPQYKATPFLSKRTIRTPSGVICPQKTPQSNHKRTISTLTSPDDVFSTGKHPRASSVLTPRNSAFNTPSGFMKVALDISYDESLSTPAKQQRSTPPQMRLSENDHSMEDFYI